MGIPSVNIGTRQINREKYINVRDCDFNIKALKKKFYYNLKKEI